MQSKITLKNIWRQFQRSLTMLSLFAFCLGTVNAQTTLTTNFTLNNGNGFVTFNFTNNNANAVIITNIGSVVNLVSGDADVSTYYKSSAINGAPGPITTANGWNQFASANVASNGLGTVQPFVSSNLVVPAGATYGICVNSFGEGTTTGAIGYSTIAAGTYTFPGGGCVLTTGTNIGYAGAGVPNAPANTPRGFIGSITFVNAFPCAGAPAPGNTVSSVSSACAGINLNLSLQNNPAVTGLTYQWQSSAAVAGPYVNIAGATNATLSTSITANTYFQNVVTCAGGSSTTSTPKLVTLNPQSACYCVAGSPDVTFEKITNVKYNTLNNATTSTAGYINYTALTPTIVERNSSYPMTIDLTDGFGGTTGFSTDQVAVYIDFNQDGDFADAGETVFTTVPGGGPFTFNLPIPSTATLGNTRMRIRLFDSGFDPSPTACGNTTYGQVQDYTITIAPCVVITPVQPVSTSISCGGTATFTLGGAGTAITYQWQVRTSATAAWTTLADGGVYSGVTTNKLTIANAPETMNSYQYRVLFGGGCTALDFSSIVTLTVTAYLAPVSPASAVICTGSSVRLFASPPPSVTTVNSGTLNITIPDGNFAGINNTIAVSGIPAGATISDISVKLNVSHNYVADLELVIEAPNGQILNLSNLLGGANGPGVNFTNTVFSSNGVNPLSSGTSPGYTGIFKPDAAGAVGAFGVPGGPTGFLPTVSSFAGLSSAPNGNWTIAMYDAGPPDQGTLNNWSISITWGVTPATATFSPVTNLFLDAALTMPYAGTAVNSVYTNTTSSTIYTAVVSNGTCSATVAIPVTVTEPITDTRITVANAATCDGNDASFTATSATGSGVTHQWKVSEDNGVTFTDVTNSDVYSGATTGTLTITGATLSMNNFKYKDSLSVVSCGSTKVSDIAVLTVNPNPTIVLSVAPYTKLTPGLTTTITATVTPNAAATYTWFRDGVVVPGATGNKIVVNIDQLGSYTVEVNDVNGCNSTSASSIVISSTPNSILYIYPSPTTGPFQVRYFSTDPLANVPGIINVFDSKGARVLSKTYTLIGNGFTRLDVDLTGYSRGIYRVELMDNKGDRIKTGTVIVL
ncbi:MAG: GEVED domain-containing protein [Ferruginibacter sp.]